MNIETKEKTMIRIATTTLALLAIMIAVPVAQAGEPLDAVDRAVLNHNHALNTPTVPIERHPPDVQDAATAAQRRNRPDRISYGPLDPGIVAAIRMHRSAAASGPTTTRVNSDRFDWSEFGVGAGAMLALVLALGTLRKGALTVRARQSQALKA